MSNTTEHRAPFLRACDTWIIRGCPLPVHLGKASSMRGGCMCHPVGLSSFLENRLENTLGMRACHTYSSTRTLDLMAQSRCRTF